MSPGNTATAATRKATPTWQLVLGEMGLALQCGPVWSATATAIIALTEHTLWLVSDTGTLLCHLLLEYAPATLCVVPRVGEQGGVLVHNVLVGACPPPLCRLVMIGRLDAEEH